MQKKQQIGKMLFLFAATFWFANEVLCYSKIQKIFFVDKAMLNQYVTVSITALLVIEIVFFQDYTIKELVPIGILSIAVLVATLNSDNNMMMSTCLFILASKYLDFNKINIITYIILIVFVLLIISLNVNGVIDERIMYRNGIIRHSLGFNHPNWLGVRLFQIVVAHVYIRKEKMSLIDIIAIACVAYFIYRVPNCQTAYYSLAIIIALFIIKEIFDLFENGRRTLARIMIYSAALFNIVCVWLSIIDVRKYPLLKKVDVFMSYRFSNCYKVYKYYGVTLFGQQVDMYKSVMNHIVHAFYLDTAYTTILLRFGFIVYVLFSTLYIAAMVYAYKKNDFYLILVLFTYAIYGIMENTFYSLSQNIFLLSLAAPIYNIDLKGDSVDEMTRKVRLRLFLNHRQTT